MKSDTLEPGMSAVASTIAYDGPAMREGVMDVRDLAPALLDLGALCERANTLLNGERTTLSVRVRSDFKAGSFHINLELVQTLANQLKGFIFGGTVASAKHIAELIGLSSSGAVTLIGLFRWLKGRRIKSLTKLQNGNTQITVINTTTNNLTINVGSVVVNPAETIIEFDRKIPINPEVLNVYRDESSLRRLEGVLRPLLKEGIDTLDVQSGDAVVERLTKEDAKESVGRRGAVESVSISGPSLVDSTYELALEIVKIPFKGDNLVWSMSSGDQKMNVEMADHAFLEKHQAGLTAFSAGHSCPR